MHTIDPDFVLGIGRVSEFGARKYHMRNFLMAPGMAWSRVYDSAVRHLFAWWGGEEFDQESGLPHLLMASWNLMVLYTYSRHAPYAPGDDRPSKTEYEGGDWQDWSGEFDAARGIVPEPVPPIREILEAAGVKDPAFLNDPVRAYYVAKNKGTTDVA